MDSTGKNSLTWNQIADSLRTPGSKSGQHILNAAAMLTTQLCALTADQPASVCTPAIRQLEVVS
jgi:hypothetical protein